MRFFHFKFGSKIFQHVLYSLGGGHFLGLPVTIAHAGLVPFLISFLVGFFVQVSSIRLGVEHSVKDKYCN